MQALPIETTSQGGMQTWSARTSEIRTRLMAVGGAGIAPKPIFVRVSGFKSPGVGFDKHDAAAEIKDDAADFAVLTAQATIDCRIGVTGTIIVSAAIGPIVWFPHHKGILSELILAIGVAGWVQAAVAADCSIFHISAQLI